MSDTAGFGLDHLPYGVVRPCTGGPPRVGVRYGDAVLDLLSVELPVPAEVLAGDSLNRLLALGPEAWAATRAAIRDALERGVGTLLGLDEVETLLPVEVGDFVDFYSSIHHATNLGKLFRPDGEPLLPSWRQLPVGYHGRSSTIVVSGTEIPRPCGLVAGADGVARLQPTAALDIELEVGFVVGVGNERGAPIAADAADAHVFGVVLVNDWSARDIQAFEYQPLGPFLGKSFATTISAWVTPLDALRPWMVAPAKQEPAPDPYLRTQRPWGIDLDLAVELNGSQIAATSFRDIYWSFAQQLAHITINGASTRPGDLFASGTVSGAGVTERGSLIELTWRGRDPIVLPDGTTRAWLADGDTVVIRGSCGSGRSTLTLGEAAGTVLPAPAEIR